MVVEYRKEKFLNKVDKANEALQKIQEQIDYALSQMDDTEHALAILNAVTTALTELDYRITSSFSSEEYRDSLIKSAQQADKTKTDPYNLKGN